jgi:putative nucleotidyltransferase-like protein/transglutaminase superfamily protein
MPTNPLIGRQYTAAMIAAWQRFRMLNADDRALTAEAAVALMTAWAGLRLVSLSRLRRFLDRARVRRRNTAGSRRASVDRIAWSIAAVTRRLPLRLTCLAEAVAADALLRRRGYASLLQIGVRVPGGPRSMEAHAWVECDGRVVVGRVQDLGEYATLAAPRLPPIDVLTAVVRGEVVPWETVGATPDELLQTCAHHGMSGIVYQQLSRPLASAGWPSTFYASLADDVRAQTASELVQREEIALVVDALASQGIDPVLIKGTPLAYTAYDLPAARPRCDTDLVVPRHAVDSVRSIMTALGYTAPNACDGELLFGQLRLEKQGRFGVGHAFDVHWRLSSQSVFADSLTYEELAACAVPVPALGVRARAAGPVHALLIACLHPAMHHQNRESLIWTYDVHLLASALSSAELERFADLAIHKSVGAVCANQLAAACSRFGTAIPPALIARLAAAGRHEASAAYLREGRRWHQELASNLRGLGWTDRLRLIREVLFPKPQYMLSAYGLMSRKLGLALVPALYIHRGMHGIWKVLAGRK